MTAFTWLAIIRFTLFNLNEHMNDYRSVQHRFAMMLPFILAVKKGG